MCSNLSLDLKYLAMRCCVKYMIGVKKNLNKSHAQEAGERLNPFITSTQIATHQTKGLETHPIRLYIRFIPYHVA